ncbi:hypothetical protein CVS40_4166 [Lucilia cuprina]|nr:hypothetical protein CVS40_4166 [Lucilia cuprina]
MDVTNLIGKKGIFRNTLISTSTAGNDFKAQYWFKNTNELAMSVTLSIEIPIDTTWEEQNQSTSSNNPHTSDPLKNSFMRNAPVELLTDPQAKGRVKDVGMYVCL